MQSNAPSYVHGTSMQSLLSLTVAGLLENTATLHPDADALIGIEAIIDSATHVCFICFSCHCAQTQAPKPMEMTRSQVFCVLRSFVCGIHSRAVMKKLLIATKKIPYICSIFRIMRLREFQLFPKCRSLRNKKTQISLFLAENLQNPVDAPICRS